MTYLAAEGRKWLYVSEDKEPCELESLFGFGDGPVSFGIVLYCAVVKAMQLLGIVSGCL